MTKYNVQVKVSGIFDIPCETDSIESAIAKGKRFQWSDILAKNVKVADGLREVIGAWDNETWDVILPANDGLIIKTSEDKSGVITLISMLGKTVALWRQMNK